MRNDIRQEKNVYRDDTLSGQGRMSSYPLRIKNMVQEINESAMKKFAGIYAFLKARITEIWFSFISAKISPSIFRISRRQM